MTTAAPGSVGPPSDPGYYPSMAFQQEVPAEVIEAMCGRAFGAATVGEVSAHDVSAPASVVSGTGVRRRADTTR
jgi:hypothetical protein